MKTIGFFLAVFFSMGCTSTQMLVSDELKMNSEIYPVKGRQGWFIGQKISYGSYTTDRVKRGWTTGYNIPFIVRFQGAKEKLSFQQYGKPGHVADVFCVGKLRSVEMKGIKDYFNIILKEKNHFAGTIITKGGSEVWDFLLYDPDSQQPFRKAKTGLVKNGEQVIEVNGVRKSENTNFNFNANYWGYE